MVRNIFSAAAEEMGRKSGIFPFISDSCGKLLPTDYAEQAEARLTRKRGSHPGTSSNRHLQHFRDKFPWEFSVNSA